LLLGLTAIFAFSVPLAYVYLNIEKKIRHHRLLLKLETKLYELIQAHTLRNASDEASN